MTVTAFVVPGQGAFYPGVLRGLTDAYGEVRAVVEEMDAPTQQLLGASLTDALFSGEPRSIETWLAAADADVLQVALVAIGVATQRALMADGIVPSVITGHSLGEIAALAGAGALTPAQAAEVTCHRTVALREAGVPAGGMVALGVDPAKAAAIVALAGSADASVAVVNGARQTVVSGPDEALSRVVAIAEAAHVAATRLRAPYAFHSPLLAGAAERFAARIAHLQASEPQVPVYSPILGRRYTADDDLRTVLPQHFVLPVDFDGTADHFAAAGVEVVVEAGALKTLSGLTRRAYEVRGAEVTTIAPLAGTGSELAGWSEALGALVAPAASAAVADALLPGADQAGFAAFWRARGTAVREFVRSEFAAYEGRAHSAQPPVPALQPVPSVAPASAVAVPVAALDAAGVLAELTAMYAEALEYPEEVFTADTDLEGELGVDSVKQTELLARVSDRYALPESDAGFRVADYPTLGAIAQLVVQHGGSDRTDGRGEQFLGRAA